MLKFKKMLLVLFIVLNFLLLVNLFHNTFQIDLKNSNVVLSNTISEKELKTSPTTVSPMTINGGDWAGLSSTESWCHGSGTPGDPYIIEDIYIDGQTFSECLKIADSNAYFIVRNSFFYNADYNGINIENVENGKLINNDCSNNGDFGIRIWNSHNNEISRNTANINNNDGIHISDSVNNTLIENTLDSNINQGLSVHNSNNNIFMKNFVNNNNNTGMSFHESNDNKISENNITNSKENGIGFWGCENNIVSDNNVHFNGLLRENEWGGWQPDGIHFWRSNYTKLLRNHVSNSGHGITGYESTDSEILDNKVYNNLWAGINFGDCINFNISENQIYENHGGINLDQTNDSHILRNDIYNNNGTGFNFGNCKGNVIKENSVNDNIHGGMHLWNSNYIEIKENDVNNNNGTGIHIREGRYNKILKNSVTNSQWAGINLDCCDFIYIIGNTANGNEQGITLWRSNNTEISENIANENRNTGISVHGSRDNKIINNEANRNDWAGIDLNDCVEIQISENTANNNNDLGIHLRRGNHSQIVRNEVNDNYNTGIFLGESNHNLVSGNKLDGNRDCINEEEGCEGNTIKDNFCQGYWNLLPFVIDDNGGGHYTWKQARTQPWCSGNGTKNDPYVLNSLMIEGDLTKACLSIRNSLVYFTIEHSVFKDAGASSDNAGITLIDTQNGEVINNYFSDNKNSGIIISKSSYITVSGNDIAYNGIGINLIHSSHNQIVNNTVNFNLKWAIPLWSSSNNNVEGNILYSNEDIGINIGTNSNDNTIYENKLSSNKVGIILLECKNNKIIKNELRSNEDYGIQIISSTSNNLLYKNSFIDNGIHAKDDGTNNNWDNGQVGNAWDDYFGMDVNGDDIGDTPYDISGAAGSKDNFPTFLGVYPELPIPGYDLYFLIVAMCGISIILVIKRKQKIKQS